MELSLHQATCNETYIALSSKFQEGDKEKSSIRKEKSSLRCDESEEKMRASERLYRNSLRASHDLY